MQTASEQVCVVNLCPSFIVLIWKHTPNSSTMFCVFLHYLKEMLHQKTFVRLGIHCDYICICSLVTNTTKITRSRFFPLVISHSLRTIYAPFSSASSSASFTADKKSSPLTFCLAPSSLPVSWTNWFAALTLMLPLSSRIQNPHHDWERFACILHHHGLCHNWFHDYYSCQDLYHRYWYNRYRTKTYQSSEPLQVSHLSYLYVLCLHPGIPLTHCCETLFIINATMKLRRIIFMSIPDPSS